jgi:hypothetical protein
MLPDFQWSHLHRSKEQIQTRNIDTRITLQISSNIKTYHVYISSYQVIECDSVKLGDAQKLMTRLGEGHGLRLFPFPRAFPVIASVATPEPRRRRPQANVTPIPNRCQLEPIASPCRFEHFQALARSTRGNRASRPIGRGRRRRPRVSSRRPFQ